jgi:hypothetical protein
MVGSFFLKTKNQIMLDTQVQTQTNQTKQVQINSTKTIQVEHVNEIPYKPSRFENFIMDYVLKFGAWALQPRNLELIITYAVCIIFLIGMWFLSVYLAGFGSEYQ